MQQSSPQILKCSVTLKRSLILDLQSVSVPFPNRGQPCADFQPSRVCLSWAFYGLIPSAVFCVWLLSLSIKVFRMCHVKERMMLYSCCGHSPLCRFASLVHPFSSWGTFGPFPFYDEVRYGTTNMGVKVFVWPYMVSCSGVDTQEGDCWVKCIFNILRDGQTVFR